ncbi:hypothetical protein KDA11_06540 [Candidatus Saccharibacteria bacterium]|nr:hypothetical protein [Candidatus Saccharibacteria bacterium]
MVLSELKYGLITVSATFKGDTVNEATDTEKLSEWEHPVIRIKSNFGDFMNPEYAHLFRDKEPGKYIKGRKPKTKSRRIPRAEGGSGKEFDSQITIYVVDDAYPGISFGVKVFRKNSIQQPGFPTTKLEDTRRIITNALAFVNKRLDKNIELVSVKNTLINMKCFTPVEENHGIDLKRLGQIIENQELFNPDERINKKYKVKYTGDTSVMSILHPFVQEGVRKTLRVNITQNGKISYLGINDEEFIRYIHEKIYVPIFTKFLKEIIVRVYIC